MKHFYAISHSSFSRNDSDEKITQWKTAKVYRFDTRAERDAYCSESDNNQVISAKRAKVIGWYDANTTILQDI